MASDLIQPTRRGLIAGLTSLVAAPSLVRASSLMSVKMWRNEFDVAAGDVWGAPSRLIYFAVTVDEGGKPTVWRGLQPDGPWQQVRDANVTVIETRR